MHVDDARTCACDVSTSSAAISAARDCCPGGATHGTASGSANSGTGIFAQD
jgi:hypothetical protein